MIKFIYVILQKKGGENMEEKKVTKISLSTYLLVIAIFAIVVMGALILMINKYRLQASSSDRLIIRIIAAVVIVLTVIGRLVCGVHWFTDIIGGLLLGFSLIYLYRAAVRYTDLILKSRQKKNA